MDAVCLPAPAQLYHQFYVPAIFDPLAQLLLDFAPPPAHGNVLDLACGTGAVARRVAERIGNRGSVLGVDINPQMLSVAGGDAPRTGARIEFIEADVVTSIFPIAHFDVAYCQQGMQFFDDRSVALQRVRIALKPGGPLAIATWQGIEHQPLFAAFAEVEARHLAGLGITYDEITAPFSFGDPAEIYAGLSSAGFERIAVEQHELRVNFSEPRSFARRLEIAYAAVVPAFAEDVQRFNAFVDAVERDTRDIVQRFTVGNELRFTLRTNLAIAHAP